MQTLIRCLAAALMCVLFVPGTAVAQSAIAGTVKDSSGAVLPGVTVEASSPALIERTRSVVTDGQGVTRSSDLRPGIYTVTFTLADSTPSSVTASNCRRVSLPRSMPS